MQLVTKTLANVCRGPLCLALGLALASLTAVAEEPAAFIPGVSATLSTATSAVPDNSVPQVTRLPVIEPVAGMGVTPSSYVQPAASPANDLLRRLEATEAELRALRQIANSEGILPNGESSRTTLLPVSQLQDMPNSVVNDEGTLERLEALEKQAQASNERLPLIRLSGFFQLDQGVVDQSANNRAIFGDVKNAVDFRRVRLQALGNVAEFTRYSIEVDFVAVGRPSFMDVWGEQTNLPFFGAVRIGHFRQPTTMDGLTSVRHLEFFERSAPFWSFDPFRRTGIMAYRIAEDELSTLAYSMYATGFTFFNGSDLAYATLGDTRFGSEFGDSGGISFAIRGTHLLYYDEPAEGAYLLHVGGGYNYGNIGGEGTTGPYAKTYQSRALPGFFQGDLAGGGLTVAGTPVSLDTGRIVAHSFNFYHTELAGNYGPAHFQTEFMATTLNQFNGPQLFYYGAYLQGGYFLTGEHAGYNRQTGVMDYNVKPFAEFFGLGKKGMCGWGAWEVAARWSYTNLNNAQLNPANQLSASAGPPPSPNPGQLNNATLALNWWWNQYTRVQFNWIHTMIDNTNGGPSTMNTFASRFQIEF